MKRLFLTSQVQHVAHSIAEKLGDEISKQCVYITTSFHDRNRSNMDWQIKNRASLVSTGFNLTDYDISGKSQEDIERDLAKYETMYIEGGNSFYLLQESQKNGFGEYVKSRVDHGLIYISTSAGSVIAGPDIEPVSRIEQTSLAPELNGTKGYGLIDSVIMPHWGSEEKRAFYENFRFKKIYNEEFRYILLSDKQYLEVKDNFYRIVDVSKEQLY